jgi:putative glutamine amidotransferase
VSPPVIAITQRVQIEPRHGERRDALDQRWAGFFATCGLLPLLVPNDPATALALVEAVGVRGLVLTGGNDLAAYGGDAPERDETEMRLLDWTEGRALPVLAVCRGMQVVQHRAGIALERVPGHVAARQTVSIEGTPVEVNSYHGFGTRETVPELEVWAVADDGVIKAVRRGDRRVVGVMWHPERLAPFAPRDIALFRRQFGLAE